ncbi:hypothetical protein PLESTB_001017000 [Pleodorina starrii]|uniref:Malonyl-CoA decarboxylase n=1 Tax=Pleodorina starrii TaxID=330485 RepID=A0A9W6F437_9CHLO|nr:hypothetical protein PLESTM_001190500 [Pleodorina starrii]GLC55707.1 hypothetical protein PLESTB_001017000 [Pleodorina starrii]GLC65455.1 hypothetical protein PLESTF_000295400 [Pleodorina starrii]
MLKAAQRVLRLQPYGKERCVTLREWSSGIDNLRQVLHQLGQDVEGEARAVNGAEEGGPLRPTANAKGPACNHSQHGSVGAEAEDLSASSLRKSAVLIKELLRIFTRKVPGGLVPDGLVRGFMQAYSELQSPRERLTFFRLVAHEMGPSVAEVTSAVRLWHAVQDRPAPPADPSPVAAAVATARLLQPPPPPSPAATASIHGGSAGVDHGASDAAYRAADRIISACRPLYWQLFLPISQAPQGIKFLVDLRADLLQLAAEAAEAEGAVEQQTAPVTAAAPLRAMAEHLRQSLAEWFSVGLLQLQPISWQESPAALLERVMRCEAVHPLGGSWEELRRRLGPRRRVFAFTHPCMPGEPLVVLHTALMSKPAAAMSDILEETEEGGEAVAAVEPGEERDDRVRQGPPRSGVGAAARGEAGAAAPPLPPLASPPGPTTAVFYSISSSQPGLRGIDLGQFLIKRAAERLMSEHPSIRRLVTLSPLPNFRSWLISRLRQEQSRPAQQPAAPPPPPLPGAAAPPDGSYSSRHGSGDGGAGGGGGGGGGGGDGGPLLRPAEADAVVRLAKASGWDAFPDGGGGGGHRRDDGPPAAAAAAAAALLWLLEGDRWLSSGRRQRLRPGTHATAVSTAETTRAGEEEAEAGAEDEAAEAEAVLRPVLLRLAARYLVAEKRRRFALCPVAHFHLRNGASMWRLNWRADLSPLGLSRSCGIMVNYEYELPYVYDNNWKYIMLHEVRAHPQVSELL